MNTLKAKAKNDYERIKYESSNSFDTDLKEELNTSGWNSTRIPLKSEFFTKRKNN